MATTATAWVDHVTTYAEQKLQQQMAQLERCAGLLAEGELWHRANEHCNSVGNLLLHLTGNVRQWVVSGLGGRPFDRNRPQEFAARGPGPVAPILAGLKAVVDEACAILRAHTAPQLLTPYTIQGYSVTGIEVVMHVVEHFSFHTGQVIHMTKALKDVDLSLYDAQGRRLAGRQP